jgi:hypothetical protein
MSKHTIVITDDKLYNDIVDFCKMNNEKINIFCQRVLKKQLLNEKYSDTPFGEVNVEKTPSLLSKVPSEREVKMIMPYIKNMVDNYTKSINDKIIDEIESKDVSLPYEIESNSKTLINGNISEKYKKEVPSEYYGEIKVEKPKNKKIRRL